MIFADPRWLWGLLALPVLLLPELAAMRRARRDLARLTGERAESVLRAQVRAGSRRAGAVLRLVALAALLIGAAGPEWGREVVRRAATGSDVVMVVDVSASMDARDVAPSRLDEARREALAVLERLAGSRVGVVAFAGDAVRLCPLTLDRDAARLTLESLASGSVSDPGTDLGRALRVAVRVMPPGSRDEQAIVLWTDGEDLERRAGAALDAVTASGVRVFAVGVGTPAGSAVPVLDAQGRAVDVKREADGGPVVSRLDEGLLRSIARRTRGAYFSASRPGGEVPRLLGSLGGLARSARGTRLTDRPVARFPLFAGLAALLLAFDLMRSRRRREAEIETRAPLQAERGSAAAALALLLVLWPARAGAESDWARGDRAFRAGSWASAESLYERRLRRGGPDEVRVNLETARVRRGDGLRGMAGLAALAGRPTRTAGAAAYNLGTILGEREEYARALAALRIALVRDPRDGEARWNYEILLRRQRERQQQDKKQQEQKPQPGGGGGPQPRSGARPPQPLPQLPAAAPQQSPVTGPRGAMSRAQAERLLDALADLERSQHERNRRARVSEPKKEKDW